MRKGWEYKRWKEVLTIINGKNQSAVVDENGEYPIYGSGGIMGYANNWLCPENCVIIGRKGNINKPIFVETKFWNVDTAFGLNANKEYLLPKFLYYFCLDYNFERHNKAVTIPSLTKVDLLKIDIPLPPKSTQLAIVSELDKINELIRLKKEQLKDFDNLAQSLFYEMFGDPVENEMGWNKMKWKDVLTIINGKNQSAVVDENGDYPIYGSGGIMGYANNWLCPEKCTIIGRKGNINKPIFVESKFWNVDTAFGLKPNIEILSPRFLFYFCLNYNFERHNKAVTIPSLTKADLLKIDIPLPPLPLQRLFAQRIEQIEREKSEVQKSIQDLETLLASRMQYWFE
jgi:type I restriction enzyme S subunit